MSLDYSNIQKEIDKNNKKISPLAYVKMIESIYESNNLGTFNTDSRLDRALALLNIVSRHNHIDYLGDSQTSIQTLNSWRSQQGCKPHGFDLLVKYELDSVFYMCIKAGFGTSQLRAASYIFDFDTLKDHGLLELRDKETTENKKVV
jgi:hypothetical protein